MTAVLQRLTGASLALLLLGLPVETRAETSLPQLLQQWEQARALNAQGHAAEALLHLQFLRAQLPNVAPIELELGLAYLQLGRDSEAKAALKEVQANAEASLAEQRLAQQALDLLKGRAAWQIRAGGALVPQSNAARKSDHDTIILNGMTFILDEVAASGLGVNFDIEANYRDKTHSGPVSYAFSAGLSGAVYRNSDWNDYSLSLEQSLSQRLREQTLTLALGHRFTWNGTALATRETSVSLRALTAVRHGRQTQAQLQGILRTPLDEGAEGDEHLLRGSWTTLRPIGPHGSLQSSVVLIKTDAPQPAQSGLAHSLGFTYTQDLENWGQLSFAWQGTKDLKDGISTLIDARRKDSIQTFSVSYAPQLDFPWAIRPTVSLSREERHSNIALYEWSNTSAGVFFTRDF